jgi:mannan endo-1,4-beta-mannosidase
MMFNYFQGKGLNNLIWVWTAEPNDGDKWYPGDNYVDIIGRDVYNNQSGNGMYNEYRALKNRYPNKIITLSECGNVAEIADQWSAGATWSWFMPWYDPTGHSYASATYWKNAFANDKVISRDQMPNLK